MILALALSLAIDSTAVPRRPPDAWVGADKFQHAGMSYAITAFSFSATRSEPAAIASAAAVAIAKEIYDRKFSVKDLVWDAVGIALGYAVIKQARS